MKKFFGEFKKFITRGNIVDMSVGVIVGGAFTAIVNSLSNNILKPIINWLLALILGQSSLAGIYTYLKKVIGDNGEVDLTQSIYIDWGAFINAIINFLIIAFVLFTIVKMLNKLAESKNKAFDQKARIEFKKEKGLKLTKKEIKFLKAQEEEAKKALEEKQKAEEEERIRNEEEEKKLYEMIQTEVTKLETSLDLETWQVFYVDSILTHDYQAMRDELMVKSAAKVSNTDIYVQIQDKWMEQIYNAFSKVFDEDQWAKYLKQGAAREKKARDKRAAKRKSN